jgi:hypothetical protein
MYVISKKSNQQPMHHIGGKYTKMSVLYILIWHKTKSFELSGIKHYLLSVWSDLIYYRVLGAFNGPCAWKMASTDTE